MYTPYIGITGFMERYEVDSVLKHVPHDSMHLLMVGVLASSKTMEGITNKWPNRYPAMDAIEGIFPVDARTLNLIHFNTKQPERLHEQLERMTDWGGNALNGFQLNIAWPDIEQLRTFRLFHPDREIVLQLGEKAMREAKHDPSEIALRVREYAQYAEYVLVDPSGGYGNLLDAEGGAAILRAIEQIVPDIGLGIAGGLSAQSVGILKPVIKRFPHLCIDAEGRLRTDEDHLDLKESGDYVEAALQLFGGTD